MRRAKIEGPQQRGFENAQCSSSPHRRKLSGAHSTMLDAKLQSRGFENPVKLFASLPSILSYVFENIDRKIRRLYLLHGDRRKSDQRARSPSALLEYKWRRVLFAVSASHADGLQKLIMFSPRLLAAAKGIIPPAASALKGLDTHQIIEELVKDNRIDPSLIRALSRI